VIIPTAEAAPAAWRYTTEKPADGWEKTGFDDIAWKEAPAGFGGGNPPNVTSRTQWKTADIWLRREIELPAGKLHNPAFRCYHDEDVEIYVNGILAAKATGFVVNYDDLDLTPKGAAALKPGKNLIAIHCHQTMGGQFIDTGLVDMVPAK
jgi:hypothetical protein